MDVITGAAIGAFSSMLADVLLDRVLVQVLGENPRIVDPIDANDLLVIGAYGALALTSKDPGVKALGVAGVCAEVGQELAEILMKVTGLRYMPRLTRMHSNYERRLSPPRKTETERTVTHEARYGRGTTPPERQYRFRR